MSTSFIHVGDGKYFNINNISYFIHRKKENVYELFDKSGGSCGKVSDYFSLHVTDVIPVSRSWSMCYLDYINKQDLRVEPVLSWGLTILGSLVPITASFRQGAQVPQHALLDETSRIVYELEDIGASDDKIREWIKKLDMKIAFSF